MKFIPVLIVAVMFCVVDPASAQVTKAVCETDFAAMIDEAERNRESSLAELNAALRLTSDEDAAGSINQQINQTWEMEEAFRKHAATAYRDCMNYVKSGGS